MISIEEEDQLTRIDGMGVYTSWLTFVSPKFLLCMLLVLRIESWPPEGIRNINTYEYGENNECEKYN